MTEKLYLNDSRIKAGKFDEVIARENSFKLGKNGCFDITLMRRGNISYVVEIYMKLQFFFIDGDKSDKGWANDEAYIWSQQEKNEFIKEWHMHIKTNWAKNNIGNLANGKPLSIVVNVTAQQNGWMWDDFEIDITKIPKTPDAFKQSKVCRKLFDADVELDSKDLTPKASGQLTAIHEFGHMIGLPDEYKKSSPHVHDRGSIMHAGIIVRDRHFKPILDWSNEQLKLRSSS